VSDLNAHLQTFTLVKKMNGSGLWIAQSLGQTYSDAERVPTPN